MESLRWNSVFRGHHVYKDIFIPFVGEILCVRQEDDYPKDCFAVCIVNGSAGGDNIIGHVPREVSHEKYHLQTFSFSSLV